MKTQHQVVLAVSAVLTCLTEQWIFVCARATDTCKTLGIQQQAQRQHTHTASNDYGELSTLKNIQSRHAVAERTDKWGSVPSANAGTSSKAVMAAALT